MMCMGQDEKTIKQVCPALRYKFKAITPSILLDSSSDDILSLLVINLESNMGLQIANKKRKYIKHYFS